MAQGHNKVGSITPKKNGAKNEYDVIPPGKQSTTKVDGSKGNFKEDLEQQDVDMENEEGSKIVDKGEENNVVGDPRK